MNHLPIVFSFDDNLFLAAGVCISSLLENAAPDTFYDIYILHGENVDIGRFPKHRIIKRFPHCSITPVSVGRAFEGAFEIRGITAASYYRLLIPELIPQYDKVLYADVDVIFRRDLGELYQIDLDDAYVAGNINLSIRDVKDGQLYAKTIPGLNTENYIYAGLLVMNCKKIREDNLVPRFRCEAAKCYKFQDMDVLNLVCADKKKFFPSWWQMTTYEFEFLQSDPSKVYADLSPEEFRSHLHESTIHYNGQKPWKGCCLNFDIWWEYYRRSIFFDEKFYFDFFYDQLNNLEQLPFMKRLKVLIRYFVFGRKKSRLSNGTYDL